MSAKSEIFDRTLRAAVARRGAALMGVCNVTPDSFSDGGKHFTYEDACARVDHLVAEGADFIDIGAESTRPGAEPVADAEQLARALDVVRYAASRGACVSIDTASPGVAKACLDAGAIAVNDVTCLSDASLAGVVAAARATLILMHSRGKQADMPGFSLYPDAAYADVVRDVVAEWASAAERAMVAGVHRRSLVMDPGLGFAKNARHSTELLQRMGEIARAVDAPVLVGASRKSFLRSVDATASPVERLGASVAAATFVVRAGASAVRVHDVRATRQAIDMIRLLRGEAQEGTQQEALAKARSGGSLHA